MRTAKPTPEAFTAGSQMRVRKVLREIGVPAGGEEQVVGGQLVGVDVSGDRVEPVSGGRAKVRGSLSLG